MKKTLSLLLAFLPIFAFCQKSISVDEAKKMIDETKKLQIIDVRTQQEFESGYIDGALNIDWRNPEFVENIKILNKKKPVLIYCRSGKRSLAAMNKLVELGFKKVYNMEGGIIVWGQKYELKK